ncbi:MAG: hypothetical protein R3A48_25585 [Polyangiales bacterium]
MTQPRSHRLVWSVVASLSLGATSARAQTPPVEASQASAAQARFDAGRARFEAQDWEGAQREFRASLELYRSPNTQLYLGLCALRMGRVVDAFNTLTAAAESAGALAQGDSRYASTRERALRELETLDGRVARLALRVPESPPALTVRVAGALVPPSALGSPQAFLPGEVEVVAEAPGFQTFRRSLRLAPGGLASVDVTLQRLAPPASPVVAPVVPPASATRGGGVRTAGFVVGALSLAGFGMFVGFGLQAQSRYDELIAACRGQRCPARNVPAIDEGQQWQTLANVGLGAGVGLLVVGTIMVAVGGPRAATETQRASVRLWTDPSRGMLGVAGAF